MSIPVFLQGSGTEYYPPGLGSDWDTAFIDGAQVPGLVKCVPKTSRKIDVANAAGLDAATLRLQGIDPGTWSLVIVVWTRDQLAALEALLAKVAPVAGRVTYANGKYTSTNSATGEKRPASFTVYHPALAAAGLATFVVGEVEWFAEGPVKQSRQVTLSCTQALPPKKIIPGTPQLNAANLGGVPNAPPSTSAGKRGP